MKIQYASDLHLEFDTNKEYLKENPLIPSAEILVLAGDICYRNEYLQQDKFWDYCSENWKLTFWVPGNHEYYGGWPAETSFVPTKVKIRSNVTLINNTSIKYKGVEIFFTTLWSRLDYYKAPWIIMHMSDFKRIKYKDESLDYMSYNSLHHQCLLNLERSLRKSKAKKKVIVTHHVPSEECNPKEFKGSMLNSGFVTDLQEVIEAHKVKAWIYGHHHRNLPQRKVGETTLVTNQLGYVVMGETEGFSRRAVINV